MASLVLQALSPAWAQAPSVAPASAAVPASAPAGPSACEERVRDYQRSQACYAPYRTATGAVKPEAFAACGPPVPDPSGDCVQRTP